MSLEADNATMESNNEDETKDRLVVVAKSVSKMAGVISDLQTQFQDIDKRLAAMELSDKVPSTQEDDASRTREFLRAYKAVRSLNKLTDHLQAKRDQSSVSSGDPQREKLLQLLGVFVRTFDSSDSMSLNTRDDISTLAIDEGFASSNKPECIKFESEFGSRILSAGDLTTEQLRYLLAKKEEQVQNYTISQDALLSKIALQRNFCIKTILFVIIFTGASFSIGLCTIWKTEETKLVDSSTEVRSDQVTHSILNSTLLNLTIGLDEDNELSLGEKEFTNDGDLYNEAEKEDVYIEDVGIEADGQIGNHTNYDSLNSDFTKNGGDVLNKFESNVNVSTQVGESRTVKLTPNVGLIDEIAAKELSSNDIDQKVDEERVISDVKDISSDGEVELKFDELIKEADLAQREDKKIRAIMFRRQIYTAIGMTVIIIVPQFLSFSLTGILGRWVSVLF